MHTQEFKDQISRVLDDNKVNLVNTTQPNGQNTRTSVSLSLSLSFSPQQQQPTIHSPNGIGIQRLVLNYPGIPSCVTILENGSLHLKKTGHILEPMFKRRGAWHSGLPNTFSLSVIFQLIAPPKYFASTLLYL